MKYWLKDPLFHFLIAGGLLFFVYGWIYGESGFNTNKDHVVRITVDDVEWLKQTWGMTRQRQPTNDEVKGMVASYLKETLLAREAREFGLDENDTVVRRRLAQKMEFLLQDTTRLVEPGEEELRRYYSENRSRYETPARISFSQIFFKTEANALTGMEAIATGRSGDLGDSTLLQTTYALADWQLVESLFGPAFTEKVFTLDTGRWQGPVASPYGYHLVRISAHLDAEPRPYEVVQEMVVDDWNRVQQDKAYEQFYDSLLKKYDIIIDESVKPLIGPLAQVAR